MLFCRPDWEKIAIRVSHMSRAAQVEHSSWGRVTDCQNWNPADGPSKHLTQAMESFPSGHTANAFAAATFLALYLNGKLKAFSDYHTSYWKMLAILAPLIAACFVAGSVVIDHVSPRTPISKLQALTVHRRITIYMTWPCLFPLVWPWPCSHTALISHRFSTTGRIISTCHGLALTKALIERHKRLLTTCHHTGKTPDFGSMIT